MIVKKLKTELQKVIEDATEIYIAAAIVSLDGLDFILDNINSNCVLSILIGIDLPTPDAVFQKLLNYNNEKIKFKAFTKSGYFHPKLYLVKTDLTYVFIGSGNFTTGGLEKNIELFNFSDSQSDYEQYYDWFIQYFGLGTNITQEWVDDYRENYKKRKELQELDKQLSQDFKNRNKKSPVNLASIDFTNQFFKLNHYQAFEYPKPTQRTPAADKERSLVKDQLMLLHEILYPAIQQKKLDLHHHDMPNHIVSSHQHGEYTSDDLSALWLHYGRSQPELDKFKELYGEKQSSLYHMRLQVLVHEKDLAIWLRVGQRDGSWVDRTKFKENLAEDSFRLRFFNQLTALPSSYFIEINGVREKATTFSSVDALYQFVRKDDIKHFYFIIGREYSPNSPDISISNIKQTILNDFKLLLPLYQTIKAEI